MLWWNKIKGEIHEMKWKIFFGKLATFLLVVYVFSIISQQGFAVSGSSLPSKLMVYVGPPKVLADRGVYDAILVQLQDSGGKPARAPQDIVVSLSSSKTDIGSVDPTATIRSGTTSALAKFFSTYTAGSTTITAASSSYTSGQATIKTSGIGEAPSTFKVYVGPPKVTAEGAIHESICIQLLDSNSRLARAPKDITVTLTSSSTVVGNVEPTVTIRSGNNYAVAKFYSTYRSGSTTITAVASGYTSGQATMSTVGPIPSRLAVYGFPPMLPADGKAYDSIIVQLQDAGGNPARDPVGDISVTLSSSNTEIGKVDSTTVIYFGYTFSTTKFYSNYTAGSTTITAAASDYTSGQAAIRTYLIDVFTLTVSATAHPTSIKSGEPTTIRVYVTYDTISPAPGATVKLVSDKDGSFSSVTDERNGYYTAVFTAPPVNTTTVYTIMVTVSKTGYAGGQGQVRVTINPKVETSPPQTLTTSPSNPTLAPILLPWVALGVIIAGVVVAIVIVKKRLGKPKKPLSWQTTV